MELAVAMFLIVIIAVIIATLAIITVEREVVKEEFVDYLEGRNPLNFSNMPRTIFQGKKSLAAVSLLLTIPFVFPSKFIIGLVVVLVVLMQLLLSSFLKLTQEI